MSERDLVDELRALADQWSTTSQAQSEAAERNLSMLGPDSTLTVAPKWQAPVNDNHARTLRALIEKHGG